MAQLASCTPQSPDIPRASRTTRTSRRNARSKRKLEDVVVVGETDSDDEAVMDSHMTKKLRSYTKMSLDKLPVEILMMIVQNVVTRKDRCTLRLTCKLIKDLVPPFTSQEWKHRISDPVLNLQSVLLQKMMNVNSYPKLEAKHYPPPILQERDLEQSKFLSNLTRLHLCFSVMLTCLDKGTFYNNSVTSQRVLLQKLVAGRKPVRLVTEVDEVIQFWYAMWAKYSRIIRLKSNHNLAFESVTNSVRLDPKTPPEVILTLLWIHTYWHETLGGFNPQHLPYWITEAELPKVYIIKPDKLHKTDAKTYAQIA